LQTINGRGKPGDHGEKEFDENFMLLTRLRSLRNIGTACERSEVDRRVQKHLDSTRDDFAILCEHKHIVTRQMDNGTITGRFDRPGWDKRYSPPQTLVDNRQHRPILP